MHGLFIYMHGLFIYIYYTYIMSVHISQASVMSPLLCIIYTADPDPLIAVLSQS